MGSYLKYVQEIREALEDLAEPGRKDKIKHYAPTSQEIIGVRSPDLRGLIKELKAKYKHWPAEDWIGLSKALVHTGIFECQVTGFELIAGSKKWLGAMKYEDAADLMCHLDNWASVDHFSVGIFGVLWRLGEVQDRHIQGLLESDNVWERRVAVVSTVSLNLKSRGGTGDTVRTVRVCEQVVDERHPMIWKALSWALRQLSRMDREAVESFLDMHGERMSKQVLREVRHKLEFGTKN
jgi:3-methyladenine DNA glycosylase AlkD